MKSLPLRAVYSALWSCALCVFIIKSTYINYEFNILQYEIRIPESKSGFLNRRSGCFHRKLTSCVPTIRTVRDDECLR